MNSYTERRGGPLQVDELYGAVEGVNAAKMNGSDLAALAMLWLVPGLALLVALFRV
jgi:hypothetical protein